MSHRLLPVAMKYKTYLMMSGMTAVFFYILHIATGSYLWKGYSQLTQPISDLTAAGVPYRNLLLIFTSLYSILAILFALSFTVLESKKHHKFVFWGAAFFTVMHFISIFYGIFPEDLPGQHPTFPGKMHIILTALMIPMTILSPLFIGIGYRKEPGEKYAGNVSILAGIFIFIFGGASAVFYLEKLPYFGLIERLNIGTLQAWTFYLSFKLTREMLSAKTGLYNNDQSNTVFP